MEQKIIFEAETMEMDSGFKGTPGHNHDDDYYPRTDGETMSGNILALTARVEACESAVDIAEDTIEDMETDVAAAEASIATLQSDLDTAEGEIDTLQSDLDTAEAAIDAIEAVLPAAASADNRLADKAFVNSSIATNTATYIASNGQPFASVALLNAYAGTVTNNDYAFVTGTDENGNTYFDRYKATVNGSTVTWAKEYRLNNSSFTEAQWSAISSGITATDVASIHTHDNKDVLDDIDSAAVDAWDAKSVVSGTNDGTNWTGLTVNGVTKNITVCENIEVKATIDGWNQVRYNATETPNVTLPSPTANKVQILVYLFTAATANATFTAPSGYILGDVKAGFAGLSAGNAITYTDLSVGYVYKAYFNVISASQITLTLVRYGNEE